MNKKVKTGLHIFFLFLMDVLIVAAIYMKVKYPYNGIGELIFCLQFESPDSDITPLTDGIKDCLPFIIGLLAILLFCFYSEKIKIFSKRKIFKVLENRKLYSLGLLGLTIIVVLTCLNTGSFFYYTFKQSKFIEENYVPFSKESIEFDEKRNLIYIILESFEGTLLNKDNGGSWNYEIMKEVNDLVKEDDVTYFTSKDNKLGYSVIDSASYTTGSLITNSSAVPFKYKPLGVYEEGNFLNGLYTLGDVLYDNGYHNELISSATTNFGGLKFFYKKHGKYGIIDVSGYKEYGLTLNDTDLGPWGFNDRYMFNTAKERLNTLSKEDEPFNLTLIGIDTHFPKGFNGEYTLNKFDDEYANSYATESYLLYDFITWVRKQDFYENTTIVVMGDHLSMQLDFFDDINQKDRYAFICYINAVNEPIYKDGRTFTALDTFPSILSSLGANVKDDQIGLGVNMFSDKGTLAEKYGLDFVDKELQKNSTFYTKLVK